MSLHYGDRSGGAGSSKNKKYGRADTDPATTNDITQPANGNAKFGTHHFLTGTTDPYITLQNTLNLNTTYTIEMWVYHSTTPGTDEPYFALSDSAGNNGIEIQDGGTIRAKIPGNGYATSSQTGWPLSNNAWHHIMFVYKSNQGYQLYNDGNRVGIYGYYISFTNQNPSFNAPFTKITWKSPLYGDVHDGLLIDEIRISEGDKYNAFTNPAPATITVPTNEFPLNSGLEIYKGA